MCFLSQVGQFVDTWQVEPLGVLSARAGHIAAAAIYSKVLKAMLGNQIARHKITPLQIATPQFTPRISTRFSS